MAKMCHDAKAIVFAKSSVWVKKLKMPKRCDKRLNEHIRLVVCKKSAQQNTQHSKNESILKMAKIGHDAKAIVF